MTQAAMKKASMKTSESSKQIFKLNNYLNFNWKLFKLFNFLFKIESIDVPMLRTNSMHSSKLLANR